MVIQWDLMGFNGIYDGIASGKHNICRLVNIGSYNVILVHLLDIIL